MKDLLMRQGRHGGVNIHCHLMPTNALLDLATTAFVGTAGSPVALHHSP